MQEQIDKIKIEVRELDQKKLEAMKETLKWKEKFNEFNNEFQKIKGTFDVLNAEEYQAVLKKKEIEVIQLQAMTEN